MDSSTDEMRQDAQRSADAAAAKLVEAAPESTVSEDPWCSSPGDASNQFWFSLPFAISEEVQAESAEEHSAGERRLLARGGGSSGSSSSPSSKSSSSTRGNGGGGSKSEDLGDEEALQIALLQDNAEVIAFQGLRRMAIRNQARARLEPLPSACCAQPLGLAGGAPGSELRTAPYDPTGKLRMPRCGARGLKRPPPPRNQDLPRKRPGRGRLRYRRLHALLPGARPALSRVCAERLLHAEACPSEAEQVISGMLMMAWRRKGISCTDRFNHLQLGQWSNECYLGAYNSEPYGADPIFAAGRSLFDERLERFMEEYYDPSTVDTRNGKNIPRPFNPRTVDGIAKPFLASVYIKANLSGFRAMQLTDLLSEAMYLDQTSSELFAVLPLYNPNVDLVSYITISFVRLSGGQWEVSSSVTRSRGLPDTTLAFALLNILWVGMVAMRWRSKCRKLMIRIFALKRRFTWATAVKMFATSSAMWSTLQMLAIAVYALALIMEAFYFDISDDYDVYNDDYTAINYLLPKKQPATSEEEEKLLWMREDNMTGFEQLLADLANLGNINNLYNVYYGLQSLCFLGLILEFVSHIDFQKRLGLVADTLKSAKMELLHLLAVLQFLVLYLAALMTVIRGDQCYDYSTIGQSINTIGMAVVSGDLVRCEEVSMRLSSNSVLPMLVMLLMQFLLMQFLLAILGDNMGGTEQDNQERDATPSPIDQLYDICSSAVLREARGQPGYRTLLSVLEPYWEHLHKKQRERRKRGSFFDSASRYVGKAVSAARRSRLGMVSSKRERQASSLELSDGTRHRYHEIATAIIGLVQPSSESNSVADTFSQQGRKTRRDRRHLMQETSTPAEELEVMVQKAMTRCRGIERKSESDPVEAERRTSKKRKKKAFFLKTAHLYVYLKSTSQFVEEGHKWRVDRLCSMVAEDDVDLFITSRGPRCEQAGEMGLIPENRTESQGEGGEGVHVGSAELA
ncbi:hypothetical protein CYMTET_10850 [Cymbomonas tetramitiformis]|uniref:Polycystin cation channel PKD1/PKD2 domain-containing protein n=1 Tax=Cymbomonas tetramitiformis TaxID=36881 RepID=A0AAE0GNY7_9CHLO|nr:hypothetical protein CYMTET_10850 [Cymbomonas tetramitiformis]